jgi:hypothetical protein
MASENMKIDSNNRHTLSGITDDANAEIRNLLVDPTTGRLKCSATVTVATPTTITVANEATDTTCFPLFATAATGDLGPKSNAGLTFNSNTGDLGATKVNGLTLAPQTNGFTIAGGTTSKTLTVALDASVSGTNTGDGTYGIANTNYVKIDATDVADNDYAKFTANGLEGRSYSEVLSDIGAAPTASPTFTGAVTLPTGLTGVLRADSGVVGTDTDVTDLVSASSDTVAGKIEIATSAEINTGTDNTRAVSPDAFAGSNFGKRAVQLKIFDDATAVATGNGKLIFCIPPELNGMNLVDADAYVTTVSSSGAPTIMIRNVTDAQDMLSTAITIDANETTSYTAATQPVINTTYDDVATGDLIAIDVDAAGTGTKGLGVLLSFQLP